MLPEDLSADSFLIICALVMSLQFNRLFAFLPPLWLPVFSQFLGGKEGKKKKAGEISAVFLEGVAGKIRS